MFRLPEVSMPTSLRTSTWSFSIRRILEESTTVIIMGKPSGTATTKTVTAKVRLSSKSPRHWGGWESRDRRAGV